LEAERKQAEIERVKAAKEKAKQDALIAKQQAELKAEKERLEAIAEADRKAQAEKKAEAERLAKAPKKEKLTKWIDDLALTAPDGLDKDAVVMDILAKFAGFKKWAKSEVDKL
jgi:membrane protein involved in colicin uptake